MAGEAFADIRRRANDMPPDEAAAWLREIGRSGGKQIAALADMMDRRHASLIAERERLHGMQSMERDLQAEGFLHIGGVDEAGRGPLAGPVVAACVILTPGVWLEKLNDSKKLSAAVRDRLHDEIRTKAVAWGVGICGETVIDRINILNATKKAMEIAIGALKVKPDALILDAVRLELPLKQISIPRADSTSLAVAAASVLAKVTRDRMMDRLDAQWPEYGFKKHKGYGTPEHIEAIRAHGPCPSHRRSFIGNFV